MANRKQKILIIEDDIPIAEMYRARLEMEGYEVEIEPDGKKSLIKTQKEKPDLIILDIMLPEFSGENVLEELKKSAQTKDIPIIILTALGRNQIKDLTPQVEESMIKSEVSLEDVVLKVKKVLDKR